LDSPHRIAPAGDAPFASRARISRQQVPACRRSAASGYETLPESVSLRLAPRSEARMRSKHQSRRECERTKRFLPQGYFAWSQANGSYRLPLFLLLEPMFVRIHRSRQSTNDETPVSPDKRNHVRWCASHSKQIGPICVKTRESFRRAVRGRRNV